MTETSDTSKRLSPPANRLDNLGRSSERRKPREPLKELTARMKLLVIYQIEGCPHADLLQRIKRKVPALDENGQPVIREVSPEPGEPLSLIEAADLLRIRRRNARELASYPVFKNFMAAELQRFRDGEKIASMQRIVGLRDELGQGKAADRKVQLAAAQAILGEPEGSRGGTTVNITSGGRPLVAGIVIRIREDDPHMPLDEKIIDHEDR